MLLYFLISYAMATESWLIKAPEASPHEFVVYLQNSEHEKISSYFMKCDLKQELKEDFEKGQILFLDGDLNKSKKYFLNVVDKKWSCDWTEDERALISFSFFRIAQIENTQESQNRWIEEAIYFDDTFLPDQSLFPPPLIAKYQEFKQTKPKKKILLPPFSKKFSAILRNGRFLSLANLSIEEREGAARYTFISDTYLPEKFFISLNELEKLSANPRAFVHGTCENPILDESLRWQNGLSIFFSLDCIKEAKGSSEKSVTLNTGSTLEQFESTNQTIPNSQNKTWLQRNGLWLGTIVVGSLLLNSHLKSQESEQRVVVPTTTLHQ
jgi:hypothetical protein